MGNAIISIAGAMFGIPLALMLGIALTGTEIPGLILSVGGWSMAPGLITAGIGAALALLDG